jgi:DNA-binding response OmpR family regulator
LAVSDAAASEQPASIDAAKVSDAAASEQPASIGAAKLVLDKETFTASYKGKQCFLGNTKDYALLERLNRRTGVYLDIEYNLIQDVWRGEDPEKGTVQKTVSNLRKKLKEAGFEGVVIDGTQKNCYALKLS